MKILITGATGFLGKRLAQQLVQEKTITHIRTTGRNETAGSALLALGTTFVKGDLETAGFVKELTKNIDVVVHSAALAAPWGRYEDFYKANILATQHLLEAAEQQGVQRFIHISTPSIYFNGKDRLDIHEDDPLPRTFTNFYAQTKFEAEKLVNQAFTRGFATVILRPRAIIGAGDLTLMPRLLAARQSGRLRIIGDGNTLADLTAVSNVVHAIRLAFDAPPEALGKAYNITNGQPVRLWDFISQVLSALHLPLSPRKMPYQLALALATALETFSRLTSGKEPVLTRQGVGVLAKSCTLNIDRAKILLGYVPQQTLDQAVQEFLQSMENK